MKIEKDDIRFVSMVDSWAQEFNRPLDRSLSYLYGNATGGWEQVAAERPADFIIAFGKCIAFKEKAEEAGYL